MDQNKPARYLDTAYNALKANPPATNQILQAAAQGAPVGLRGLAAAAAQQSQQEAQRAMAALQQQGPQPNVIQKLATQGIMSQMDTGLPVAPQMAPMQEEAPQMMAGGGLVAFADGGNVLPPDVIEAIQSHFAEGGDVRGFAEGDEVIGELIRKLRGPTFESYYGPTGSSVSKEMSDLDKSIRKSRTGAPMLEGMERATDKGQASRALYDEMSRIDDVIRRQRSAAPMLEGMGKAAEYTPTISAEQARPGYEELYKSPEVGAEGASRIGRSYSSLYPKTEAGGAGYNPYRAPEAPMSMTERLATAAEPYEATARAPVSSAMEKLTQAVDYSPEAVKKAAWTGEEGFRGFRLPSLPEPVKKVGRLLAKNPELMLLTDPRIQAAAGLYGGAGKMVGEHLKGSSAGKYVDEGVDALLEKLRHHSIPEGLLRADVASGAEDVLSGLTTLRHRDALPFAAGGDVRGFKNGDLLKALTGPTESPGMWAVNKLRGLFSQDEKTAEPAAKGEEQPASNADGILSTLGVTEFSPSGGLYKPEILGGEKESKPKAKLATYQPAPQDGHEVTPRLEVHPEGQKVTKEFDQAKTDTPSAAVGKGLEGLAPGVDMEKMRDLIMGLRGHKEMAPEVKQKLEDLESSARTSTILQSVLGGLGAGLSSPYGGRFALGKAALGSLAGYQHGVGSEEDIGRKGFDVLRGYADAPAEEKAKAVDLLFGQLGKSAELQSAERIADLKGMDAMERLLYTQGQINQRAGQGRPATEAQLAQIQNLALDNAQKRIDSINKQRENAIPAKPPLTAQEEQAIMREAFANQQQFIQSGGTNLGLGGGQLGARPITIVQ